MACPPDAPPADMCAPLAASVHLLSEPLALLASDPNAASQIE